MPHYLVSIVTRDPELRFVERDYGVGGIVAANLNSAIALADLRYQNLKQTEKLRQSVELVTVRSQAQKADVAAMHEAWPREQCDFAELMQVILGARPVSQLTTKNTKDTES